MVTLEAVRRLTEKGFRTVLGVSNVSFGLPARQLMNNTFMDMAMEAGLSAAIVNPGAAERKRHPAAERALRGEDPGFAEYILAAGDTTAAVSAAEEPSLERAVRRGLAEEAEAFAWRLLETVPPIEIIEREIMPALNRVGEDFQKHIVFLPQLLMSAEAAGRAFDVIRAAVPAGQERADLSPVVLATVRGDVHDIGKNIVRLLLENYGFPVLDLGKDVPPEKVLAAARESRSALVGLSALMTTTVPAMEETISLLKRELPGVRTVVGGAVLTEEYAASMGADRYAADAMDTVRYAGEVLGET
jgi:5-methyltetrahydrofolate--homocysteine methyltransferase